MGMLDTLLGPMLIGTVLNVLGYGIMIMQCFVFFTTRTQDPAWIKLVVAFLFLADTLNCIFNIAFTYIYTISHFGDFKYINKSNWLFNTDPVMTVIISSTVQTFYAWRVGKLTKNRWLYYIFNASSFIQFLCGLGTTIGCSIVKDFFQFQKFRSIVIIWLSLSATNDIGIAIVLVRYLRKHRTGLSSTETLITRLVRITVQTGALCSVWALIDLIVYLSFANTLHLIFNMALSKLYSNSLMSSLNARSIWADADTASHSGGMTLDRGAPANGITVITTSTVHHDTYELNPSPSVRTSPVLLKDKDLVSSRLQPALQYQHGARDTRRFSHLRAQSVRLGFQDNARNTLDELSYDEGDYVVHADEEKPKASPTSTASMTSTVAEGRHGFSAPRRG